MPETPPTPDALGKPLADFSAETVRHVADLARLDLREDEVDRYAEQLQAVADLFGEMDQFDTTDVKPATHASERTNIFRRDELQPCLTPDELFAGAPVVDGKPVVEDQRFRVPKMLEEEN